MSQPTPSATYAARVGPARDDADADTPMIGRCFGHVRGERHEVMLDLRQATGRREAFGYSYLVRVALEDTQTEMTIHFTSGRVTVRGTRLGLLYTLVVRHKVIFIQAIDPLRVADVPATEPEVTDIRIELPH